MSESRPRSYQQFFAELKRRKVFRVIAAYGVIGFAVIEAAEAIFPRVALPDWSVTLVVWLTLLGFPIAVVLAWAFESTPEGVRRTKDATPEEIEAIVAQPASRRWLAGLLALVGGALLLYGGWWAGRQSAPGSSGETDARSEASEMRLAMTDLEEDDRPTIAVLPFADMSREGDQEYFSDGITEELLNTLAKIRDLKVMARTSAFAFKGQNLDMRAVGDSLDAQFLVEGSVRKAGDQLRITAQLIDAGDGSHLWSETYDRRLENVFEIQTEIAEAIAEELRVPLGLEEGERLVLPTEDLEAFDLYLAGRSRMRERGDENIREAIGLFEAAIARDSSWAPAWAGLAEAKTLTPHYVDKEVADSTFWANSLADAERAAERALELDPRNASAMVALASAHRDRWDWDAAEAAFERALALDPESVEAHQQYAEYLSYVARLDEAYAAARRALALDRAPIRLNIMGLMAILNERYDEAEVVLNEGLQADSARRVAGLYNNLARVHLERGDWAAYRRTWLRAIADLVSEDAAEGLRAAWPEEQPLTTDAADRFAERISHLASAAMFLALGREERALDEIEEHFDGPPYGERPRHLFHIFLDPVRDDPRFQALLPRHNLEGVRPQRLESQ
ncbi:MAG TPA: hypothetical protein VLA33_08800 [Gemmatimonadota bacterium]|nr:hypothetical protein [Gemmatimonadota bacterium]